MSSISNATQKEERLLLDYAAKESMSFPAIDKEMESYYVDCNENDIYMMKYDFQTIPELHSLMSGFISSDIDGRVQTICEIATMKAYMNPTQNDMENVPEHRYVF